MSETLGDDLVVRVGSAAGFAVALAPGREPESPLVQLLAALTQRQLE